MQVEVDALKIRLSRIMMITPRTALMNGQQNVPDNKRVVIETRLVDRREPRTFRPKYVTY